MNTYVNENKMLQSALIYAQRLNFAVIPLNWIESGRCSCKKSGCFSGKHPLTQNGVKDATKDVNQIIQWWKKWPKANVGIACGQRSGIFVLDVDVNEEEDGRETIRELESKFEELPVTPVQLTGSGGMHYIFKYNEDVKNLVKFLPGLDTKSEDGYIVAAPSTHISGKEYIWEVNSHIIDTPIVVAPNWLLNLVRKDKREVFNKRPSSYWTEIIKGTKEGNRNNVATSLTGYLFRKYMDVELICGIVEMWNERNTPPLTPNELENIVISVAKLEAKRRNEKRGN